MGGVPQLIEPNRGVERLRALAAPPGSTLPRTCSGGLPPDDLRDIEAAFAKVTVHDGRMNPMRMEVVDG